MVQPTGVLVEGEVRRGSSRGSSVRDSAVLSGVGVVGHHPDHRCPRCTLGTQTDGVARRVEGGPVIVDVHQIDFHVHHRAQAPLSRRNAKHKALLLYFVKPAH